MLAAPGTSSRLAFVRLPGHAPRQLRFDGSESGLHRAISGGFGIPTACLEDDEAILICDSKRPHEYRKSGCGLFTDHCPHDHCNRATSDADSTPAGHDAHLQHAHQTPLHMDVEVLFRLRGGKGGFGALLKKLTGGGKKTTNMDAMRDLSGRRLRHAKTVERFQEWMQKKKDEDEMVAMLMDGELAEPELAKRKEVTIGDDFMSKLEESGKSKLAMLRAAKSLGAPGPSGGSTGGGRGFAVGSGIGMRGGGMKRSATERDAEAVGGGSTSDASTDVDNKLKRAKVLAKMADSGANMEKMFATFMEEYY
eukprot:g3808.t1